MQILKQLLGDWTGILSLFTVAFVLVMAGFLIRFIGRQVEAAPVRPRRAAKSQARKPGRKKK